MYSESLSPVPRCSACCTPWGVGAPEQVSLRLVGESALSKYVRHIPVVIILGVSNTKTRHPGFGEAGWVTSPHGCFMEPDDCSCSATNRKSLLEPHPSRRLTVFQLVKFLKETYNSVLSDISESVHLRDDTDEMEIL